MFQSIQRNQYIALLLIQAAEIDFHFDQSEKDYILNFVSEAEFMNLVMLNSKDRMACHHFLKNNVNKFFPTEDSKKGLKNNLLNLCLADKSYNNFERTFMQLFREEFLETSSI